MSISLVDAAGRVVVQGHDPLALDALGDAPVRVVAVLGPQGSGKSTLCNALCGEPAFPVAPRGVVATATTRGVDVATCATPKPWTSQTPVTRAPPGATMATSAPERMACGPNDTGREIGAAAAAAASGGARRRRGGGGRGDGDGGGGDIAPHQPNLVLDVEGADARDRGRSGRAFQAHAAAFAASVADAVLLNLWYHDTGRVDSAGYGLLRAVLATAARRIVSTSSSRPRATDELMRFGSREAHPEHSGADLPPELQAQPRTALVFVIRDVDDDTAEHQLSDLLRDDAEEIWDSVAIEAGLPPGDPALHDAFDVSIVLLPHMRHHGDRFADAVAELGHSLYHRIITPNHSKNIPADGFLTYASSTWDSLNYAVADVGGTAFSSGPSAAEIAPDDYYAGEDLVIVAAYRCDEIFSVLLSEASGSIGDLHDLVDQGTKVEDLGEKCERLIANTLEQYEAEAADFADEPVFDRKRRELEAIIDTGLHAVFLRQVQILREEAIKSFKRLVDGDLPEDYAIFTADAQFVADAKRCQRLNSNWSYACERADLQNMLSEIAAQHRKLVTTQVTASEQQSQAIRILQMQNTQLRAVQQQAIGGAVGQWSIGAAYRPPDTNVNVSLGFQHGRTSLNVSMVPDESASLLGPSGFTAGVLPGNIGLSFNLNM